MAEPAQGLERENARLQRLVEASYAVHTALDTDVVLARIIEAAMAGVDAVRGTVYLLDAEAGEIWSRVVEGGEVLEIRLPVGKGIAGAVAATGETIRIADAYADERFDRSWDEKSGFRTREILCAPIRDRTQAVIGVFQLLNCRRGAFESDDEEFLAALSAHAAQAIENARLHRTAVEKERYDREVELARQVQLRLQPRTRRLRAGTLDAVGFNEVCEDASGDYYDLLDDVVPDRLVVALGDVSGHGLQAALVMSAARAFLRAFVRTQPVADALAAVSSQLEPDLDGSFVSLFVAVADPATGRFEWANAGHNPPCIHRAATGALETLRATGPVAGILQGISYAGGEPFALEPGDSLLAYTDGLSEARSAAGELFGDERVGREFAAARGEAADVLASLRQSVEEWEPGVPADDRTAVVIRRAP